MSFYNNKSLIEFTHSKNNPKKIKTVSATAKTVIIKKGKLSPVLCMDKEVKII